MTRLFQVLDLSAFGRLVRNLTSSIQKIMLTALQMKMTIVTHFHLFALVTAIEYGFYTDTVCEIGDTLALRRH